MPGDNPKYVVIDLFVNEPKRPDKPRSSDVANPMVYKLNGITNGNDPKYAERIILRKLREHIKKYGTIEELVISGHGGKQSMMSSNFTNEVNTKFLLENIEALEKELGKKIANRVVFDGCSTFSNLSNNQIKFYRDFAHTHDMEIVGSTSTVVAAPLLMGRYIQFTPKGEVVRDKLDTRYVPDPNVLTTDDRTWVDYHLGNSQEQAERLMRNSLIAKAAELVRPEITHTSYGYYPIQSNKDPFLSKEEIHRLDNQTDKTDVLLTKNDKGAVIISSNGMVHTFGDVKLHKLTESEKFKGIKDMEEYIGNIKLEITHDNKSKIEAGEKALSEKDGKYNPLGINFSIVVMDDNKRAILATENGGYEVIDIQQPIQTPDKGIKPNGKPSPPEKGK